ncbi:MAG: Ig family protein, partial [Clostridiales bacterium]|nr:Ig family protein [Clostridiales bacterium]
MILSTPSTGFVEDVSSRTQYVTIDTTNKTKYLKALVCWPKGQVGVPTIMNEKGATIGASNITYTNLSLADMNYGWQEVVIQLDSNLVKAGSSLKLSYSLYNTSNRTTTKIPVSFVVSNVTGIKAAEKLDSVPFSGNVSTGNTGLKILGNKAFNFNLPNGLKAVMQYDFSNDPLNGTFSMLIGYNKKMPEDGENNYAGAISDVKELIEKGADALGGGEGEFGFKVAGFMMGNVCYRNGEWILVPTGGGLLGAAEVGYSYSQTAVIGIIPVNYGVELKAGVEATLLIDSTTVTAGVTKENFGEMFDFYLKVYGSIYAYGGIGFDAKIIAARIGIFGTLGLEYYFRTAVIENIRRAGGQLKLTGSIGIEAVVKFLWWKKRYVLCEAGFEKKFKPNGFDYTNYGGFVRPDLPGMKRMMVIKGSDGTDYEVYEGEFEIEDRDYLSAPQVWSGGADNAVTNGRAKLFGMLNSTVSTKNIATNIYTYADPIVSTDGNLMVTLSDFGSIDINETGAAYSIKNSEGVWSAPARISSQITPASNLAFSGSSSFAAAAWEGVEERITFDEEVVSDVDIAASIGKSEIYASVYDGTNFVTKQITKNSEADMIPEISANGDKAIVVWQRIAVSAEDPTKIEGKNEILYSVFNGTSWSDEIILDSGDAGIVKTFGTAMASDGTAVVTLSIDTDGDSETYPDMEVFNYRIASDGTVSPRIALTSNTSVDSNPQVIVRKLNVKGMEQEYFLTAWYNETAGVEETLRNVILDVRELNGNKVDGFTSSFGPASGNFSFIKSTDSNINTVGIVWSEAVSQGAQAEQTLYAKLLTDGIDGITTSAAFRITTGDPNYVELSELETVAIRNLDSVTLESIYIKKNIEIDQDDIAVLKTNSTDIVSTNITIIDTAEITNVSTDASNASINSSLPVTISVRNNGFSKITGFKVKANDQSYVLDKVLLPDQTTELQIDYLVANFDNLEIEVIPIYSGMVEGKVIRSTIKLLAPDISIQSITQTGTGNGGSRTFDISLSNVGTKALVDSGYKINVAVFEDFERKIPSEITDLTMNQIQNGELEISDNDILKAIDDGNGTIRVGYTIEGDSYNSYGNKTLFITITVVDENGFEVNDFNSINNDGGITFVSPKLLYTSQFDVTVVQNNSEGITNADLTVRNLYPVAGEDTLRLRLLEGNVIIEEKTIDIKMGPESITKQTIEFTKSGSNVVAVFGADLVEPTPTPTPTDKDTISSDTEAVVKETGKDGSVEVKAIELEKAKTLTVKSDITIVFDETSTKSLAKVGDFKVSVLKADSSKLDTDVVKNIGDRPIYHITVTSKDKNITSFDGGYVTLSIPYTLMEGESSDAILIYYIDADGNAIPAYSKYDATTKSVLFTTNHFSTYAVAYNKITFSDVSGWAENYITYLAARNIIVGVGYGKFTPEAQVTRAQFTKM